MHKLLEIMKQLRDPEMGCSWDKKQTFDSLFPYTLEEVHEVGDTIDRKNMPDLKDELGDLLFQIVFYAQIAEEKGAFNFQDVVEGVSHKMLRRHPHVFEGKIYQSETEQEADWEAIKKQERVDDNKEKEGTGHDAFADITQGITALQRSQKVLNRAGDYDFDWRSWKPIIDKVYEEVDEIIEAVEEGEPQYRVEEEIGDLFIVVTNLARHLNVDAENATRKATNKFAKRFNRMMQIVKETYPDCKRYELAQMSEGWELVKKEERDESVSR